MTGQQMLNLLQKLSTKDLKLDLSARIWDLKEGKQVGAVHPLLLLRKEGFKCDGEDQPICHEELVLQLGA